MPRLALNMICRNEAPRIANAIAAAAAVCDELIVVDTGSTDETVVIAEALGATVMHFPWCDDFSAARNFALDNTAADWILVLDADDEISNADVTRIHSLVLDDSFDAVFATYEYAFRGDNCVARTYLQRLIRRTSDGRWQRRVHESFAVDPSRVRHEPSLCIQHHGTAKRRAEEGQERRLLELSIANGEGTTSTLWYLARAIAAEDRGRAAELFRACLDRDDATVFEKYDCAKQLYLMACEDGSFSGVLEYGRLMIAIDASRPDAHILRGIMLLANGNAAAAVERFVHALSLPVPSDGVITMDLYTWIAREHLARAYRAVGETDEALTHARIALTTHPDPAKIEQLIRQTEEHCAHG